VRETFYLRNISRFHDVRPYFNVGFPTRAFLQLAGFDTYLQRELLKKGSTGNFIQFSFLFCFKEGGVRSLVNEKRFPEIEKKEGQNRNGNLTLNGFRAKIERWEFN